MTVVDVHLSLAVSKEDRLAVGRPLDVGKGHSLDLLAPDAITIHRTNYNSTYDITL